MTGLRRWLDWGTYQGAVSSVRARSLAILLIGLIVPQLIIYSPSFFGGKVLLPLDILAKFYEVPGVTVHDPGLSDLVTSFEPWRQFSANEFAAGRLTLWNPTNFAGAPFCISWLSPFHLIYVLWPAPESLAWIQLLKSVFAGLGAYLFFRSALRLSFWPAAIAAWCLPITGFFTVWQGFYASATAAIFPWLLLATHATISHPRSKAVVGLACITALTLTVGQIDIAAQALLASGFYALWLLVKLIGTTGVKSTVPAGVIITAGWLIGFMLAAPYLLPLLEYIPTGARMIERAVGMEARPPTGLSALLQILIPDCYGARRSGWAYIEALNPCESAASGFTGIILTLVLAPLAWCEKSRRRENLFWVGLGIFTLGWTLNIPGLVSFLRLPVLNMMSHNRFVFVSSFALLVLAALGMEAVRKMRENSSVPTAVSMRSSIGWWFLFPVLCLVVLCGWCLWRLQVPSPHLMQVIQGSRDMEQILGNFRGVYLKGAMISAFGLLCWGYLMLAARIRTWSAPVMVLAIVGECLIFAVPFNAQSSPKLYYPELPLFSHLRANPGRVLAVLGWPPNILSMHGLRDVRGYDGVDPQRVIQLMETAEDKRYQSSPKWARTRDYVPIMEFTDKGQVRLRPALNMLNVRWLIFMGPIPPQARPVFQSGSYWVIENVAALPRVFVPRSVQASPDTSALLTLLAAKDFDPGKTAYANAASFSNEAVGEAKILSEIPDEISIQATMHSPGMVVLGDQWYPGWRAWVNGKEAVVHQVNHALRGVSVPAGVSHIVYRYEPFSFKLGCWLMLFASVISVAWLVFTKRRDYGNAEN